MALLPIIAIFNYFIFFWEDLMEAAGKGATRVRHQRSAQTINFKLQSTVHITRSFVFQLWSIVSHLPTRRKKKTPS